MGPCGKASASRRPIAIVIPCTMDVRWYSLYAEPDGLNGEDLEPENLHGAVLEKGNLRGWDRGREHEPEEMSPEGGDEGCEDGEPMCREEGQEDAFGRHA